MANYTNFIIAYTALSSTGSDTITLTAPAGTTYGMILGTNVTLNIYYQGICVTNGSGVIYDFLYPVLNGGGTAAYASMNKVSTSIAFPISPGSNTFYLSYNNNGSISNLSMNINTWQFMIGFYSALPQEIVSSTTSGSMNVTIVGPLDGHGNVQTNVNASGGLAINPLTGYLNTNTSQLGGFNIQQSSGTQQVQCDIEKVLGSTISGSNPVPINITLSSIGNLPINLAQIDGSTVSAANPLPIDIAQVNQGGFGGGAVPVFINGIFGPLSSNITQIDSVSLTSQNIPINIQQVLGTPISTTNCLPINQQEYLGVINSITNPAFVDITNLPSTQNVAIVSPLDTHGNVKIDIEDISGAPQTTVNGLNVLTNGGSGPAGSVNISQIGGHTLTGGQLPMINITATKFV